METTGTAGDGGKEREEVHLIFFTFSSDRAWSCTIREFVFGIVYTNRAHEQVMITLKALNH